MDPHRFVFESTDPARDKARFFTDLREFARAARWSIPIGNEIELIFEEWWTNLVNYAFAQQNAPRIEVQIESETNRPRVHLEIRDNGIPFDPASRSDPDLTCPIEERPVGGLGIYMMKKLSMSMTSKRFENRNILSIEKDLARPVLGSTKG